MPSLTVLFMGRRKKITIGANTPLSEALAQARTVFNVNQKLSYELRRRNQKTAVDLTCPFRLSGISNNAQLELVVTSSKSTGAGGGGAGRGKSVRVGVQLPSGQRVIHAFPTNATLQQISGHFRLNTLRTAGVEVNLVYLQRLLPFSSFATTTLQSLGFSGGSCMFRVRLSASTAATAAATTTAEEFPPPPRPPSHHAGITYPVRGNPSLRLLYKIDEIHKIRQPSGP